MRFQLMSDLHLEFGSPFVYEVPEDGSPDVVVLAGDIIPGFEGKRFDKLLDDILDRVENVVLVAGNHEGYDFAWEEVITRGWNLQERYPGLVFLNDSSVEVQGVTIFGGTAWTDMDKRSPVVMNDALFNMNDYNWISYKGRRLNPADTVDMHEMFLHELRSVSKGDNKLVVVSHHAPTIGSIDIKYRAQRGTQADNMNHCFYSSLEYEMDGVDFWFHGHTHSPSDYYVGDTRVVANPRGYPGEKSGFNPTLVIEV